MLLNHVDTGSGEKVAVLLHGMMGSAESWWRVAEALAADGYRVISLDLPGHGLSPRDPDSTLQRVAGSIVETVRSLTDAPPALAIGHSIGGRYLAIVAPELKPESAVYAEAPFSDEGGYDRQQMFDGFEGARVTRTVERMRAEKAHYGERDLVNEALAAERFDSETAAAVSSAPGGTWYPLPGSLVIRADPSDYISDDDVARLEADGVTVRSIPGAAHSLWYSNFDDFMAALDGWR